MYRVNVLGLGSIGLPIACLIAASGYQVRGIDTNPDLIKTLSEGKWTPEEPGLQKLFNKVLSEGSLKVSTQPDQATTHLIAVPTPLSFDHKPVLTHLDAAFDALKPYLNSGNLVLIESTCPVGTTEILAKKIPQDIRVAYCPERVLPGNILHELVQNDRVVGGVDPLSTEQAIAFYQTFVVGKVMGTDSKTAEAVKIAENTYRDINIAYANELSIVADQWSINIDELIRLANHHPRVNILKPGPGVGGRCIAVNPWFMISAAPNLSRLAKTAREVNDQKTRWVTEKIKKTLQTQKAPCAILGLTYKADVADLRQSPALEIVEALESEFEVLRVDPYVTNTFSIEEALARAHIVVGLVPHQAFQSIPRNLLQGKTVLDFAGIFT